MPWPHGALAALEALGWSVEIRTVAITRQDMTPFVSPEGRAGVQIDRPYIGTEFRIVAQRRLPIYLSRRTRRWRNVEYSASGNDIGVLAAEMLAKARAKERQLAKREATWRASGWVEPPRFAAPPTIRSVTP